MARSWYRQRIIGAAIIVENANGSRMIMGIRDPHHAEFQVHTDHQSYATMGSEYRSYVAGLQTIRLEVEGRVGFAQSGEPVNDDMRQLPSGIYLPNMQFRLLPPPKD